MRFVITEEIKEQGNSTPKGNEVEYSKIYRRIETYMHTNVFIHVTYPWTIWVRALSTENARRTSRRQ